MSTGATLGAAGIAILLAMALLLARVIRPRPRLRKFTGFFIYDRRSKALVEHDLDYELGRQLSEYMKAAFVEDSSIRAIWERNPLYDGEDASQGKRQKSLDLMRQAAEYFVLRSFSTRLTDHFNSGDFDPEELDTLSHTDLPDVLLENRFLRLFSEPMENRAAFEDEPDGEWTTVVASGEGGALYERFELVLPKGWRVARAARNQILITTKRFVLTIRTDCDGWGAVLPWSYVSEYLGLSEELDDEGFRYSAFELDVSIRVEPRSAWRLRAKGWRYYQWIDEWIADLEPQISQHGYFDRIQYQGARTILRLLENRERRFPDPDAALPERQEGSANRPQFAGQMPFEIGDEVEHATFGRGYVIGIEDEWIVVVEFPEDNTTRKLVVPYAPLRLLSSSGPIEEIEGGRERPF